MSDDPLQYQKFFLDALREVMRKALAVVVEDGLPEDHYFHITFRTDHPGVEMPQSLRLQYPSEMAIVLQHVFYDLEVDDTRFSVSLSFNRIQQRLTVPLEAVTVFQDPPARINLPFLEQEQSFGMEEAGETGTPPGPDAPETEAPPGTPPSENDAREGGNVISFDAFQNKN